MLRWRYHAQEEAAGKAERRKKANETGRSCRNSAGSIPGDLEGTRQMMFAMFMLVILAITGLIWLLDSLLWAKKRAAGAAEPAIVEYSKSFFPVILVVFLIR